MSRDVTHARDRVMYTRDGFIYNQPGHRKWSERLHRQSVSKDTKQSETRSSERPPSYSDDRVTQLSVELKLTLQVSSDTKSISRDECVAHLKFLAVLADLRENISSDDGLFGINDFEADRFPE